MVQVQDRNLGVAEARVGLSIITCLLLVLGYVVLQRLGGTGQRPLVEIRSDQSVEQLDAAPQPASGDFEQPHVLTPEVWEPTDLPIQTTQRPQWLTPHEDVGDNPTGLLDPLDVTTDRSPVEQSEPLRASRAPDPFPAR
jgi:hypothetical protein